MQRVDPESGVAWGFILVAVFLIGVGLFIILMNPFVNGILDAINFQISSNHMISQQTVDAVQWNENFWHYGVPVFSLIVIFVWAVNRALYQRKLEGG